MRQFARAGNKVIFVNSISMGLPGLAHKDLLPRIRRKLGSYAKLARQTSEGITRQKIEQTINVVDTADAIKYLPSLSMRKRNYGDNQAVLATRSWGISSSARTLIYADDILLSTLIGNNNTNGAPRWGMVAPDEIERIDFLYGPFSAMYPGNSIRRRVADHHAHAQQVQPR